MAFLTSTVLFGCEATEKTIPTAKKNKNNIQEQKDAPLIVERRKDKGHSKRLNKQGVTLAQQKMYDKAIITFTKSLQIDPENTLANAYLEALKHAKRLEEYRKENTRYPNEIKDLYTEEEVFKNSGLYEYKPVRAGKDYCIKILISENEKQYSFGIGCETEKSKQSPIGKIEIPEEKRAIHLQSLYSTNPIEFGKWGFGYYNKDEKGNYIINDKKFGPYDNIDKKSPYFDKSRQVFLYQKSEKWYLQVHSAEFGPFFSEEPPVFQFYKGGWVLEYKSRDEEYFVLIDGKKEYGPYIYADTVYTDKSTWAFRYCNFNITKYAEILLNRKSMVKTSCNMIVNKREMGPYDMVNQPKISGKNTAFTFTKDGRNFAWTNGEILGPYTENTSIDARYEGENRIIEYQDDNGAFHLIINKDKIGPFPYPSGSGLHFSSDHWGFQYKDKEGRQFLIIDGNTYGPYKNVGEPVFHKKLWGFTYTEKGKKRFVMLSGKKYGPYKTAGRIILTDYSTSFQLEDMESKYSLFLNEKIIGPYETMKAVMIYGANWGFEYSNVKGENYLLVNGIKYGPYEGESTFISAYDPHSTSFHFTEDIWIYHYKDNEKKEHVVVNGEDFGPYSHGGADSFVHPTQLEVYEGNWAFWYEDTEKKQYQVVNGSTYGPLKRAYNGAFKFGKTTWGFRYESFNEEQFILIGGEKYGPYLSVNKPKLAK